MVPTKFQFIWLRGFRGIFICNSIHRDNCILNTDIYIQTRVISLLTEFFFFLLEINQSETRIACGGHVC
jgi:hypothetical protein